MWHPISPRTDRSTLSHKVERKQARRNRWAARLGRQVEQIEDWVCVVPSLVLQLVSVMEKGKNIRPPVRCILPEEF